MPPDFLGVSRMGSLPDSPPPERVWLRETSNKARQQASTRLRNLPYTPINFLRHFSVYSTFPYIPSTGRYVINMTLRIILRILALRVCTLVELLIAHARNQVHKLKLCHT